MEKLKDIRDLSLQERKELFDSFDIVMTDCDGVLWQPDSPISGALETLNMFKRLGKKIIFVSNNTTRSVEGYVKKLFDLGFEATTNEIIIPSLSIVWYLKKIEFKGKAFTIGNSSFKKELMDNGIDVISGPDIVSEDTMEFRKYLSAEPECGAIIVDFDVNLNYAKLIQVALLLKKKDILFFVGARDKEFPLTGIRTIIGPGLFIDMLTNYTGILPINFAKPSIVFKDYLFDRYAINNPEKCIFIGDSLAIDMEFADLCGFRKLWVHSGVDQKDSLRGTRVIPDYYLSSLGAMPTFENY